MNKDIENTYLNSLSETILAINLANGWKVTQPSDWTETEYKIPAVLCLITSEVSEALEAFRKNDRANFNEEIADSLIRILDLCGGLGIDIDTEVAAKLEKNKARGFRHGGKRV